MRILNFEMCQDYVSLFLLNGETLTIYFTEVKTSGGKFKAVRKEK
jgi:hypothetical protein